MERGSSRWSGCVQDHLGLVWYRFVPNIVQPVQPVQPLAIHGYSIKVVDPSRLIIYSDYIGIPNIPVLGAGSFW